MRAFLRRLGATLAFGLMLFGVFWLPKDMADWKDAAQPWGDLLSMVDQNTALWIFAFVAFVYILWVDVRPWAHGKLKARKAARYVDQPDIVAAKSKILSLVGNQLRPATDAAREAVRLSAHIFKDAWPNHPAAELAWFGILDAIRVPKELAALQGALQNTDVLRRTDVTTLERALLDAIVSYRVAVHRLQDVVSRLQEHGQLKDRHGFFAAVQVWYPTHEALVSEFVRLQADPTFKTIRKADVKDYLCDPRYDLKVLEPITGPQRPLLTS